MMKATSLMVMVKWDMTLKDLTPTTNSMSNYVLSVGDRSAFEASSVILEMVGRGSFQ